MRVRERVAVSWWLASAMIVAAAYAAFVGLLVVMGRRQDARAMAAFIPDCLVLVRRLLADPRVPRSRKALLALVVAYLALPFDLVPDFIPLAGQLDDVLVVALGLRAVLRGAGAAVVREHWPGPQRSLDILLRVARP